MARIVQKYGGTSVGSPERILNVARRIKKYRDQGNEMIVVVSAMGGETDRLLSLASQLNESPDEREIDMLLATGEQQSVALMAMALHGLGCPAISMTGAQAGIETDGVHSRARIRNITPHRIEDSLADQKVVIVAGFQGRTEEDAITTLGRGGSDLTAVALAAVLKADLCQIFTDVEGVFTADPRIVPEARKIDVISTDEMLEMASLGAKVMQSRSIEFAKKFGVVLEVRSSLTDTPGTIITEESDDMEDVVVRGVSADKNEAKLTVRHIPDTPGQAAKLFQMLAEASVNVDMIIQNVSEHQLADISCTVPQAELKKIQTQLETRIREATGAEDILYDENIAKVSVVGVGMRSHSGVAASTFKALADHGINIEMISTSEIKISCVLPLERADDAVRILHQTFKLGETTRET
ncbi:MAG: aspartate kinase [Candidatus Pacebacteria bacterium]|nr:aspartate kinase [Candidatus Paceibacterota bacterium]